MFINLKILSIFKNLEFGAFYSAKYLKFSSGNTIFWRIFAIYVVFYMICSHLYVKIEFMWQFGI